MAVISASTPWYRCLDSTVTSRAAASGSSLGVATTFEARRPAHDAAPMMLATDRLFARDRMASTTPYSVSVVMGEPTPAVHPRIGLTLGRVYPRLERGDA